MTNNITKKTIVISHERSGTHFLMNSIAQNFGYIAKPWIDFDFKLGLNFYAPRYLKSDFFDKIHHKPISQIIKSHHSVDFLKELLPFLCEQYNILYIYRDPRDVMVSGWRIVNRVNYSDLSLTTETVGEYIRAEPAGWKMRYQMKQERNMLQRWKSHVEGWIEVATEINTTYQPGIQLLRYEDLNLHFEDTIKTIADYAQLPLGQINRPDVDDNVIGDGKGKVGSYNDYLSTEDLAFIDTEIGGFMGSIGYN
jgi:hypothetical protein